MRVQVLYILGGVLLLIALTRGVKVTVSQSNTQGTTESAPAGRGGSGGNKAQAHPGVRGADGRGYHSWGGYDGCTTWIRRVTGVYLYAGGQRVPVNIGRSILVRFCSRHSCYPFYYGSDQWRDQARDGGSRSHSQRDSQSRHGGYGGGIYVRPGYPSWYRRGYCHARLRTEHRQGSFHRRYRSAMERVYGRHVIRCDDWIWGRRQGNIRRDVQGRQDRGRHYPGGGWRSCYIPLEITYNYSCNCRYHY